MNVYGEEIDNKIEKSNIHVIDKDKEVELKDYQLIKQEEILNWHLDSDDGIIFLSDEICEHLVSEIMREVIYIRKLNPELKQLTMIIDSPGGSVHSMLAIVDYFKSLDIKVNVVCRGIAMSAAAVIFACATGKRYISKHSTMMFHEISSFNYGKAKDMKSNMKYTEMLENWVYELLAEHSNKDRKFWEEKMIQDYYIDAQTAVELGVADHII